MVVGVFHCMSCLKVSVVLLINPPCSGNDIEAVCCENCVKSSENCVKNKKLLICGKVLRIFTQHSHGLFTV